MEEVNGKARGGVARAQRLSPEERTEIAKKAAAARWDNGIQAICGSPDRPLRIGDLEIPCYVLEDGTRVLVQSGIIGSLDMSHGGSYSRGGDRLAKLTTQKTLEPYVGKDLLARTAEPIRFRTPNGHYANGYEATVLADICEAVLQARSEGKLMKQQEHIAKRCEILVRGFARVGIIALVDEVTGYQEVRAKNALARILEQFIAKEIQPWVSTFPADFYREMFRLRGLDYPHESIKKPQYFGVLTNNLIYERLAPGVLEELRRVTPRSESGRRKYKFFQSPTSNIGYPKLREHLGSVVTIMKLSNDWRSFMDTLDRLHPRYNQTLPLPLSWDYDAAKDDGKGL